MKGVEHILRRLLEGRSRRWSIIIVTVVLMLVCTLPIADRYFALRRSEAELSEQLLRAKDQVERTDEVRRKANAVSQQLMDMESRALLDENTQAFRQTLVNMTRKCGCQLRSLNMSDPQVREWHVGDDPLSKAGAKRGNKDQGAATDYKLRKQPILLSVSGTLEQARSLLRELEGSGKLVYLANLSIRPSGDDRNKVVMELQIILFGLQQQLTRPSTA